MCNSIFCRDTLKLPDKHFIFILRHGSIFNFKRTLKANNPLKKKKATATTKIRNCGNNLIFPVSN